MKHAPIALILLMVFFLSCGQIAEPEFRRLDKFGIKKLSLKETVVGFNATYFNPNGFGVAVKEAAFDVYIDSIYLGKFSQPNEISVLQKAEFSIPMEGSVSLEKALQFNLPSLVGKEVSVKADGSVKLGKAGVFITKDIHYQGRHKLDAALLK